MDASEQLRGPLLNRSRRALILCYHSIARDGPRWTSIGPDLFERQLAALSRAGYRPAGQEAFADLARGARRPERAAILTFDDGYRDSLTEALPRLLEYGFRGIFFILPPYVDDGRAFDWPEVEDRRRDHPDVMRSLHWGQVGELAEAGCEVGSHGCRHEHLTELSDAELRDALWESRRAIKERLGRCDSLAYPFGEWSPRVARAAEAAGYSWAFSLPNDGTQSTATAMSIPRVVVDHRDDGLRFRMKVNPLGRRAFLSSLKVRARAVARPGARADEPRLDAQSGERVFS